MSGPPAPATMRFESRDDGYLTGAARAGDWKPKDTTVDGTGVHLAFVYPEPGLARIDPRPETDEDHVHRDTVYELPAKRDRGNQVDHVSEGRVTSHFVSAPILLGREGRGRRP